MIKKEGRGGVSLIELMIALALIGIGILGSISAFKYISRAVIGSKARTLATNLAQEKMQIVMQQSYYEILVTTDPAYNTSVTPSIPYDPYYFPPESILEGSVRFTRLTYIQPVTENSGSIEVITDPTVADTGMRQITVSVLWQQGLFGGDMTSLSVKSIANNPNTVMTNAVIYGTVRNSVTNGTIQSALVDVAENIGWRDFSNATGNYTVNLSPGNYNLVANAQGYYQKISSVTIAPNSSTNINFTLAPISTGTVKGYVWLNNHLLISQVVASTGPSNDMEYVELYNPTTGPIQMGTNSNYSTPPTWMAAWDSSGNLQQRQLVYISTFVASRGYYLITNTGDGGGASAATYCAPITVAGVTTAPNACWRFVGMPNHTLQCATLSTGGCTVAQNASGIAVGTNGGAAWSGTSDFTKYDSIAWTGSGTVPTYPQETTAANSSAASGMVPGEQFVRRVDTTTATTAYGNAYDSGNNSLDFVSIVPLTVTAHSSTTTRVPITGTPAYGAIASVTDGLSTPSTATATGAPPVAQFLVPSVATGTWSVYLDSGASSAEITNTIVSANTTTYISNAATVPSWPASGAYSVNLTTSGLIGTISGTILNANGAVISPAITVNIGGVNATVGATGFYSVRLSTGNYDVIANPSNANSSYESQTRANVVISMGDITPDVDFVLSQGGKIAGFITRDGTNPLPGVTVTATNSNGLVVDTQVSGSNGRFTLVNLSTATYTVQPVLDTKETSTPTSATSVVTAGNTVWSSTFTVTGAMGTVTGAVSASGQPIQTGVLIVVSTSTISSPPTLSSSTLTGAGYYLDSSHEDGTYAIDVRGSTSTTYNVYGYYQRMSGSTVLISSSVRAGVSVTPGQTTPNQNFSW